MKPMTIWLDGESLPSSREGMNNGVAAPAAICIARRRVIFRWDFMEIRSLAIDKDGDKPFHRALGQFIRG